MDPIERKRSVLAAAREKLESTATELQDRIADLKAVTIGNDDSESASQRESTRGSDVELMNSLSEQLEHFKQDVDRLGDIEPSVRLDVVQYGAVVHTDHRNFLIAASIEEFKTGGKEYLGVSTKAPLIQALTGLSTGETATFQGTTYTIQEIL